MRFLLRTILFCLLGSTTFAQNVYQIRADSVRIYSGCDTAELIIENHTQDTLGFLFNKGKGRTEFRKLHMKMLGSNSLAIVGQDTVQLGNYGDATLSSVLAKGNTAGNSITLGQPGNTNSYSYFQTRRVGAVDYISTYGVTNDPGTVVNISNGTSANNKSILLPFNDSTLQYSPNNGTTRYNVWHSKNHPTGVPYSSTLTGATIFSGLTFNSAGHLTSVATRNISANEIGAAPAGITLATVLSNGNLANKDIELGLTGQTAHLAYILRRTISGADYTGTLAIGAGGGTYLGAVSGANSRLIYVRPANDFAEYSSDGGVTLYKIWDSHNHPVGAGINAIFSGAMVPSLINTNFAGHTTSIVSRNLTPGDIGALQLNPTSAQIGSSWINSYYNGVGTRLGRSDHAAIFNLYSDAGLTTAKLRFTFNLANAESTGNAGSDLYVNTYSDAGALIASPLIVPRATGLVRMVPGFRASSGSGIIGTGIGTNNISYFAFYENNASTEVGGIGKGNNTSNDIQLVSKIGNIGIVPFGTFTATPAALISSSSFKIFTGELSLAQGTANVINFNQIGVGPPTTTARSTGTKIALYPALTSSQTDHAIGVETGNTWFGVPSTASGWKWYGGTTEVARLDGTGKLSINGGLLSLTNSTSNSVLFATGSGAPTFTTRTPGAKLVIGSNITATTTDYATGYEYQNMWSSVPANSSTFGFKWYGGTTQVAKLDGTGNLDIAGSASIKGITANIRIITGSYTATANDYTIICRPTSPDPILTLPPASANVGKIYIIVDENTGGTGWGIVFSPVVWRNNSYTSFNNQFLSSFSRLTVQSDGINWIVIGGF